MKVTGKIDGEVQTIEGVERIERTINGFSLLTKVPEADEDEEPGKYIEQMEGYYVHQENLIKVE